MDLFNLEDVFKIEQDVLNELDDTVLSTHYFKEDVAQYLYQAWVINNEDTRILVYCFPLLQSIIVRYVRFMNDANGLEKTEVFNNLCLIVLQHLPKYKPGNGRLYTYLTLICNFKLKDQLTASTKYINKHYSLDEEWDTETSISPFINLLDFTIFLTELKKESAGKTLSTIIDALLLVINDESMYNCSDRKMLIQHMVKITKLPEIIIETSLTLLTEKYNHSILD